MKKLQIVLIFISILIPEIIYSQTKEYKINVTVLNSEGNPYGNVKVWIRNSDNGEEITKYTDGKGLTDFVITQGNWSLNLIGLPNYKTYEILSGYYGSSTLTITYNLDEILFEKELCSKRKNIQFTEIKQNKIKEKEPEKNFCVIKVYLLNNERIPVSDILVELLSVNNSIKYSNLTNKTGYAYFYVPSGEGFIVDVDNVKNFEIITVRSSETVSSFKLLYEKCEIEDKNINDTITQEISIDTKPCSTRAYKTITVLDSEKNIMPDEDIYLEQISTGIVYKATTDNEGKAVVLLPKGEKYMLHFEYQKNVDVLNYEIAKGISKGTAKFIYYPNPKLQFPENYIPTPDKVFVNEFQNFVTEKFPEPENNEKVEIIYEWGNENINNQSEEAILEIGISVISKPATYITAPNFDIAFVLDRSGSMAYGNIDTLKNSMIDFLDLIRPNDQISIITYSDYAILDLPLQKITSEDEIVKIIKTIEAEGTTIMIEGLLIAYEQLLNSSIPENTKNLIVLTDGWDYNEPEFLLEKVKEGNQKGIQISAIGVGNDYNYPLLKQLTDVSGGKLEQSSSENNISEIFKKQLSEILFPIANKAKLEIIFNNKINLEKVYGVDIKDTLNESVTIEIGSLYSGMNKIALTQFNLTQLNAKIEDEPVIIELSYFDLQTQKTVKISKNAILNWENSTGELKLIVDENQKRLYTIAIINLAIKEMADSFAANKLTDAKSAVKNALDKTTELYPVCNDEVINSLILELKDYEISIDNYIKNQQKH